MPGSVVYGGVCFNGIGSVSTCYHSAQVIQSEHETLIRGFPTIEENGGVAVGGIAICLYPTGHGQAAITIGECICRDVDGVVHPIE